MTHNPVVPPSLPQGVEELLDAQAESIVRRHGSSDCLGHSEIFAPYCSATLFGGDHALCPQCAALKAEILSRLLETLEQGRAQAPDDLLEKLKELRRVADKGLTCVDGSESCLKCRIGADLNELVDLASTPTEGRAQAPAPAENVARVYELCAQFGLVYGDGEVDTDSLKHRLEDVASRLAELRLYSSSRVDHDTCHGIVFCVGNHVRY